MIDWSSDTLIQIVLLCRTTSTWTRRPASWWRTSWLTTKVCCTRRATEIGSNWSKRLWWPRASRAAANTQSVHSSHQLLSDRVHCRFSTCGPRVSLFQPHRRSREFWVIAAHRTSPLCSTACFTLTPLYLSLGQSSDQFYWILVNAFFFAVLIESSLLFLWPYTIPRLCVTSPVSALHALWIPAL